MDEIYLSTVTPVYHGAAFLRDLVRELLALKNTFERDGMPVRLVEAIFVDDGSIDDSFSVLTQLEAEYKWVKVIRLSRNFGQHPATIAGILHSCGDWVATLDEDLQHPPKHLISMLIEAVSKQYDVIYTKGNAGVHGSYFRDGSSRLSKAIVGKLTGNPHVWKFSSFRMLRGSIARAAAALSSHNTYFDVALTWFTNCIGTLSLPMQDRRFVHQGKSGYTVKSLLGHAGRMLTSTEVKLLRLGALIGVSAVVFSICMSGVVLIQKIWFPESIHLQGWASLILAILFFGGLTSLLIGVTLEYITSFRLHMLGRPAYFVVDRSKDQLLTQFLEKRKGA
jgi:glycosyltransferase involved in cell wall biosynthesis